MTWICPVCNHDIGLECILCDSCLVWFDANCVGFNIKSKRTGSYWFCTGCKQINYTFTIIKS